MNNVDLISNYCLTNELYTYDPYDIWKTKYGLLVKKIYNKNRFAGSFPAIIFTIFDQYINNNKRIFYKKIDYPIVRALSTLTLLNLLHSSSNKEKYIKQIETNLEWLINNKSKGTVNYGWGLNFPHSVSSKIFYPADMPLTTITPYILEAFYVYHNTISDKYSNIFVGISRYFESDVKIIFEDKDHLVTSYATFPDRIVYNSLSYTMYSYFLLSRILIKNREEFESKAIKLFNYIKKNQNKDGSWFYAQTDNSFIDCFHSCIILKNLIKTELELPDKNEIIQKGYNFIKNNFLVDHLGLVKRFAHKNKPSLIEYDLYDNAEMLNLSILLDDKKTIQEINNGIIVNFKSKDKIFSAIDKWGNKLNANMLRWAIMPYIYSLSNLELQNAKN